MDTDNREMVEAVAAAIADRIPLNSGRFLAWGKRHEEEREPYRDIARAAIEASQLSGVVGERALDIMADLEAAPPASADTRLRQVVTDAERCGYDDDCLVWIIADHDALTIGDLRSLSAGLEALTAALNDGVATLMAVRATSASNEWPEAAKHFHDLCGETIKRMNAALSDKTGGQS